MKKALSSLALIVFLSIQPVNAQLQWQAFHFFNNTGGLNDEFDPTAIAKDEASNLQNIVFTTGGAISKRQGFDNINSSALAGNTTGLTYIRFNDQTQYLVCVAADDKIYKMDYGAGTTGPDGTWDDITGSLSFAIGNDDPADFQMALNQLVIEDGLSSTAPYVWTGSGNASALGGSPPNAQFVEWYQNHLFTAGDSSNPSTLAFSNLGTIATWTGTDTINVSTNDGSIVRGMIVTLDALYVFKDFSVFRLTGSDRDTFRLELMVKGTGTLSNDSIEIIDNKIYFTSQNGDIVEYDGGYNATIISKRIQDTIDGLDATRFDEVKATVFQDRIYLMTITNSGSSTHNRIIYYDTLFDAFSIFVGINANAISNYLLGNGVEAIVFGDYSGFTHRWPTGNNDNSSAISAFYQTGWLGLFEIPREKIWRLLRVFVNAEGNYNLTVQVRSDFESPGTSNSINLGTSSSLWDTAVWDSATYGGENTIVGRIEVEKGVNFFQIYFSNANSDEPFTIQGWELQVESTDRV